MLNCKYKNLPKENKNLVKTNTSKAYIPTKIHRYKDMLMIRLSNKTIQIIYDTKDGFVYESISEKLFYFPNIDQILVKIK